ncbi:MAG: hypothetical protein WB839_22270, partial [Pseudolabrys sp.]
SLRGREKVCLTIDDGTACYLGGFADVKTVFAAIAAGPVGALAFINQIAVAIALSEFRIALRRCSEPGGFHRNNE